jgi:hypothetical protein
MTKVVGRATFAYCIDCPKSRLWGRGRWFPSWDDAVKALEAHKRKTGHRG